MAVATGSNCSRYDVLRNRTTLFEVATTFAHKRSSMSSITLNEPNFDLLQENVSGLEVHIQTFQHLPEVDALRSVRGQSRRLPRKTFLNSFHERQVIGGVCDHPVTLADGAPGGQVPAGEDLEVLLLGFEHVLVTVRSFFELMEVYLAIVEPSANGFCLVARFLPLLAKIRDMLLESESGVALL
jgi:hypothetical protein